MSRSTFDYPITNKYTFNRVFSEPEYARPLIEAVLGVPIGEIRNIEVEHTMEPSLRGRGVRMDVYVEDGSGTVYDVEMQNANEGDLELRSRYILSSFDRDRIARGERYTKLGRSVVIFVCGFDPIGLGERMYVVRPTIQDHWKVFDDGTMRVFLNAHGAADEELGKRPINARLASFLSYVDGGDTMNDEWVKSLDDKVEALNDDEGWRRAMFGLELDYQKARDLAREEGEAEGRRIGEAEGRRIGEAEGRKLGEAEGRRIGEAEGRKLGEAEGRRIGEAEGRADADRLSAQLADALTAAGRIAELPEALHDPQVKERLLAEFNIQ